MINIALEKSTNFVEIWLFVYFNTGLVRNIEQINVFLTALGTIFKNIELPSTSQKLKETQGQGSKSRAGLIGQCRQQLANAAIFHSCIIGRNNVKMGPANSIHVSVYTSAFASKELDFEPFELLH